MTKRRPFGSRDPNVQRSGDSDSVESSVPSVEEALRLKRRKKRNKTLDGSGSLLIDSTSKTPRISNRTKQLPPRRGVTKQLRRLEQSMATRAKQERRQHGTTASLSQGSASTTTSRQDSLVTKRKESSNAGVKRKELSDSHDKVASKKKFRSPAKDDDALAAMDKNGIAKDKNVTMACNPQVSMDVRAKAPPRESLAGTQRNKQEEAITKKRVGRNVAAEYLHMHRGSNNKAERSELLATDEVSALQRPQRLESPTALESNVESKRQVTQEAMMDCTSDDESLHLSPESAASPVRENVEHDKDWVLQPPAQHGRRQSVPAVEHEDTEELRNDICPRLSMTTHAEGVDPLQSPNLSTDSTQSLPHTMEDLLRREGEGPIVTKGMLSRAREAKADNEEVVAAMMKSGPPYKGRQERNPTPDASMVGTMIGVHSHERSDSVDGSEVTMLTTDSSLHDFPATHTNKQQQQQRQQKQHDTDSDDESEDNVLVNKNNMKRKTSPDDVSAVPETSASRTSKQKRRKRRSESERTSNIREPDEGVNESSQVIYFENNGVMIPHPPLPSGWIIRMSKSKQRPFYCHPDHGSTWHCPVVLPQSSSDSMLKSVYQPTVVNVPTTQTEKEKSLDNDDDTESEDSEMWGRDPPPRNNDDEESVMERQSQASRNAGHSASTTQSITETKIVEVTRAYESDRSRSSSLASGLVDKEKHAAMKDSDEVDPHAHASPLVDEDSVAGEQLQKDDYVSTASPEISPNPQALNAPEERGSEVHSHPSGGSETPRSDPSPSQHVARVSLVETEATTKELSPLVEEELVSTTHLRRNNGGARATQEIQHAGHNDDDELVEKSEATKLHGLERDGAFLSMVRGSHAETSSLTFVARNGKSSSEEAVPEKEDSVAENPEPVTEELAFDNGNDVPGICEEDEEMETGAWSPRLTFNIARSDAGLASAPEAKGTADRTVALAQRGNDGGEYGKDVARQEKQGDFEDEVGDVIFGVDHDDIDLSPQAKRLSPIKHMNSFDMPQSTHPAETTTESDDETVLENEPNEPAVDVSAPPRNEDSPMGLLDNSFDDDENEPLVDKKESSPSTKHASPMASPIYEDEAEATESEASHQDQDDDRLSVDSSFNNGTKFPGEPRSKKWRGYSHRIMHPPHPLCSLINIDALVQAAIRRMERRKKAKKKKAHKKSTHEKSSRRERRTTSTKLVFE